MRSHNRDLHPKGSCLWRQPQAELKKKSEEEEGKRKKKEGEGRDRPVVISTGKKKERREGELREGRNKGRAGVCKWPCL